MKQELISTRTKIGRHTSIASLSFFDSIKAVISQLRDEDDVKAEETIEEIKQIKTYRNIVRTTLLQVTNEIQEGRAKAAVISIKVYLYEHLLWLLETDKTFRSFTCEEVKQNIAVSNDASMFVRIKEKGNEDI